MLVCGDVVRRRAIAVTMPLLLLEASYWHCVIMILMVMAMVMVQVLAMAMILLLSPRKRFAMRWAAVFAGVLLDTLCWPRLVRYASRGLPLRRAHKQRPSNGS